MLFDVLFLAGHNTRGLPYIERRKLLEQLGLASRSWQVPAWQRGDGARLRDAAHAKGLDCIIAKRLTSTYRPGTTSPDWRAIHAAPKDQR